MLVSDLFHIEATIQSILLRIGLLTGADAVKWADDWIIRLDTLPDELVDISLSSGHIKDILALLNRLALPSLSEKSFGLLCSVMLQRLEQDPKELRVVNSSLWCIHYDNYNDIRPLEFEPSTELYWFHEWESLILEELEDMTSDELRQKVLDFLRSYAIQEAE